mgnify:CR=1 FL=1
MKLIRKIGGKQMKFEGEELTLEKGIEKEWLITNGIGGYSSSTVIGANTRKYHGLLVAALMPPGNRQVILSKLDESVEIEGKNYNLYTNIGKDYISDGYKKLVKFEKEYIPIFTYQVEEMQIKKFICMEYGKNTVAVYYYVKNGDKKAKLSLAPIVNFRGFHTTNTSEDFNLKQEIENNKVKLVINNNSQNPIYMAASCGNYIKHDNDIFRNMYYLEEEKRGQGAIENHAVPGVYEIEIEPNEEKYITFVCSLEQNIEELDGKDIINKEIIRLSTLIYNTDLLDHNKKEPNDSEDEKLIKNFIIATDNFVAYRPSFALYTILAGYHWFLDWGRDTLIAFEGLLLKTKRYSIAKEVLLTCIRDIKFGLVPNGYSGYDSRPLYNSVDASLLLFEVVKKFLDYTHEYEWIKENIYPSLVKIMNAYQDRIDIDGNNIYMDTDYLISSGTENIQNTWMDAKIGDYVVTPRNGKAVEVNSLWYNAIKVMEEVTILTKGRLEAKKYGDLAQKCQKSFNEKFYNKKRKCLYDVLGDPKIRPNQLFALSLSYPVIDVKSDEAKEILNTIEKKLLTPYGLRTLAKGEPNYTEKYEGDMVKRDMSYHQGLIWPWLLGLYYNTLKNMLNAEKNRNAKKELENKIADFREKVKKTFSKEMNSGGSVGSICELYDIENKEYMPQGAKFQAWSVAEIFRIIIEG